MITLRSKRRRAFLRYHQSFSYDEMLGPASSPMADSFSIISWIHVHLTILVTNMFTENQQKPDKIMLKNPNTIFPDVFAFEDETRGRRWTYFDEDGIIAHIPTGFLNSLERRVGNDLAGTTVKQYANDLKQVLTWIRVTLPKLVTEEINAPSLPIDLIIKIIERVQLEAVFKNLKEKYDPNTLSRFENLIKQMLIWCTSEEANHLRQRHPYDIIPDPIIRKNVVSMYSQRKGVNDLVTFEMVCKHLLALHNECERTFFHFIYDVGTRIGEAVKMKASDLPESLNDRQRKANTLENYASLDMEELYLPLRVPGVKGRAGNEKPRLVQITLPTLKRIEKYHRTPEYIIGISKLGYTITDMSRPIFLTSTGKAWSTDNARSQFRAASDRSDLPIWFKIHGLRGGAAYLILVSEDQGLSYEDRLNTAKKQLGHRWLSTLEKHYATIPFPLLARLQKFSEGNFKWRYLHDIFEETHLLPLVHSERRGHSS